MSSENIKQGNPLAEEKIGRLIARFAVPAIISMLVSSLYNICLLYTSGEELNGYFYLYKNIAYVILVEN